MNRSSSATWVKGVLDMFASQGLDVQRLLDSAGIDRKELDQPTTRIDADAVIRLWDLGVLWSGNPALGLERELVSRFVNYDLVGHAMLSSADLRSGLQQLSRYLALVSDATMVELEPAAPHAWMSVQHIGSTLRPSRQRQEHALLTILMLSSWLIRREVRPLAAEFSFPQPASTLAYQQAFGCALRFGQPATRLLLADTDLATALPSYSPDLQALHEQFIDAQINLLSHTGITDKVRELIMQSLDRGEPRREDIAARLGLTDRTLQRRLRAEDSSFQVLLDQARCELARKYLAQQELPLAAMTDLLGFGDASNFFRACKRWFHQPPGEYRKSLMAGQRTPEAAPALEHLS